VGSPTLRFEKGGSALSVLVVGPPGLPVFLPRGPAWRRRTAVAIVHRIRVPTMRMVRNWGLPFGRNEALQSDW
jgi:hypothetical protein